MPPPPPPPTSTLPLPRCRCTDARCCSCCIYNSQWHAGLTILPLAPRGGMRGVPPPIPGCHWKGRGLGSPKGSVLSLPRVMLPLLVSHSCNCCHQPEGLRACQCSGVGLEAPPSFPSIRLGASLLWACSSKIELWARWPPTALPAPALLPAGLAQWFWCGPPLPRLAPRFSSCLQCAPACQIQSRIWQRMLQPSHRAWR